MFRHILLPTDGSQRSQAAVEQGIRFAKRIGAKVTGISVVPRDYSTMFEAETPRAFREQALAEWKARAASYLGALEAAARQAGVVCEVFLEIEEPYRAIIEVAEKKGCDLILMASHGRGGIGSLILGSVTQKVLAYSRIPVLVFR